MTDLDRLIEDIQKQYKGIGIDYTNGKDMTAICFVGERADLILKALTEMRDRELNPPLTLKQLGEYIGKPVVVQRALNGHFEVAVECWDVVKDIYYSRKYRCKMIEFISHVCVCEWELQKNYRIYAHRPKEAHDE